MVTKKELYGDENDEYVQWFNDVCNQGGAEMTLDDENSYAEGFMNGIENVGTAGIGAGAFVGGAAYNGGKKVGRSCLDAGSNYNEWAQGLGDDLYPRTRGRDD